MTNYKKIAEQVINTEVKGLEALKKCFDKNFSRLVDEILKMEGRVIISGMGKSGHIANKIAATLASTGTPASFIHPGEASHGDLGMISKKDVVILLSNSGETKELTDIINYCKRFGIVFAGIVRRKESLLVEVADIPIILPNIEEASQVNAPTTSTTMMLAYGDALAVVLAQAKGFTREDFGVFHPGGKLGSQFVKAEKIMRPVDTLPLVKKATKMSDALVVMTGKAMGCVGVVDAAGKLIGIVTDGDLRRHMQDNILEKTVAEIMHKNPKVIFKDSLALEAVKLFTDHKITSVFVTDKKKLPIGAIHIHDCFQAGLI